ncbi:MAG: HEAT repeat domain-containing protein [Elusimicrobia bacterium]|nr:HEAT repeat domain-containing protein [Elusimicrobiota bacterium]
MKTCPSCGYKNEEAALKCGICGGDLSGLKTDAAPGNIRGKIDFNLVFLGVLAIAIGVYFFVRREIPAAGTLKKNAAAERPFSNDGVIYTLEKMAALKFLGAEEKAAALAAFENPDEKVRAAGVKTAGAWLRAGIGDTAPLLARLTAALSDLSGPVRKEAAMETGLLIGLGVIKPAGVPGLETKVRAFMEDRSDLVKSAGYFLAAMAELSGLKGRLEYASGHEPLAMTRLYAACALAGLGSEEGARAVFRASLDPDANTRKEAVLCLAYTASPQAVPLLRKISASDTDFEVVDYAKFSLNLRKQLAIINNKPD